jgi:hypothetical protein
MDITSTAFFHKKGSGAAYTAPLGMDEKGRRNLIFHHNTISGGYKMKL